MITLSKAKKITSVIDSSNHGEWIELAKYETSRVIEKCVAMANPKEVVKESLEYKTGGRLEFKLGVDEKWAEALKQVKDLLSQKHGRAVDSEEALFLVMSDFIERNDPVKKAERAEKRVQKKTEQQVPGLVHHVIPIANGGSDELENLTTLCRTHHELLHRRNSGRQIEVEPSTLE